VKYLLDTNLIIEAVGGSAPAMNLLEKAVYSEWVGYSAITRLELFGYPGLTPEEETALTEVCGEMEEVAVASNIVDRAIQIRRSVRIKTPDAIIAATALELNAVLVTRNGDDFKSIAGLHLINPWNL
jgi:predicted nucleic acid-binding protein